MCKSKYQLVSWVYPRIQQETHWSSRWSPYSMRWYTLGTIPTRRLKQAEGFWRISAKLQKSRWLLAHKKQTTLRTLTFHSPF
jgi:hypothetical protein